MKIEDCKPGTRVVVYSGEYGRRIGEIRDNPRAISGFVNVWFHWGTLRKECWSTFHPKQLRKLLPPKSKREERADS